MFKMIQNVFLKLDFRLFLKPHFHNFKIRFSFFSFQIYLKSNNMDFGIHQNIFEWKFWKFFYSTAHESWSRLKAKTTTIAMPKTQQLNQCHNKKHQSYPSYDQQFHWPSKDDQSSSVHVLFTWDSSDMDKRQKYLLLIDILFQMISNLHLKPS